MQVAIVGGGIVGVTASYFLGSRGVDVTLFERSHLGAGSTERALGGIRAQFSTPVNVKLSAASVEFWESFERRFDADVGYRQHGYLFLTGDPDVADEFAAVVEMQNDLGVPTELLAPAAAREYVPTLHADDYVAATYCGTDGSADPHLALQALARAAREAGVDVRTDTTVTDVRTDDGGPGRTVTGVATDDGRFDADYVVNAAGPWAGEVASMAGVDLPVEPKRRQIAVVDPAEPVAESAPLTADVDSGVYFAPDRGGSALVGGHLGPADPTCRPDPYPSGYDVDWVLAVLERAGSLAANFGPDTRVRDGWSGLYAVTPDHHPVVEESVPGFVTAAGFSGHGFMHAPATGRVVADLVVDGATSLVDVSKLGRERFERGETFEETNVI